MFDYSITRFKHKDMGNNSNTLFKIKQFLKYFLNFLNIFKPDNEEEKVYYHFKSENKQEKIKYVYCF